MDPCRVLVVEDDPDDVELTCYALGRLGLGPVEVAADGAEALDRLRREPAPELVLLDLRLPRMDGLDVLAWIRAQPVLRGLPVIILTSSESPRDQALCAEMGITAYLGKPLDGQELRRHWGPAEPQDGG